MSRGTNTVDKLQGALSLAPKRESDSATADEGASIDRMESGDADTAYLSCYVALLVGEVTGTPDSFSVACVLEHNTAAADGAGWSTYATLTTVTAASTGSYLAVDLQNAKRYIRVKTTTTIVGGTTPTVTSGACVILADPMRSPVGAPTLTAN